MNGLNECEVPRAGRDSWPALSGDHDTSVTKQSDATTGSWCTTTFVQISLFKGLCNSVCNGIRLISEQKQLFFGICFGFQVLLFARSSIPQSSLVLRMNEYCFRKASFKKYSWILWMKRPALEFDSFSSSYKSVYLILLLWWNVEVNWISGHMSSSSSVCCKWRVELMTEHDGAARSAASPGGPLSS